MAPHPLSQSWPSPSPHHSTPHSTPQWHPSMATSNGTASISPKLAATIRPKYSVIQCYNTNGTLWLTQHWHHVHSRKVGSTRPLPNLAATLPPNHSKLQSCNGTQQWHNTTLPKLVLTLTNHSKLEWHPTMGSAMTPNRIFNGTVVPRQIRQSGSWPSPPIGSKNPYRYTYPKIDSKTSLYQHRPQITKTYFVLVIKRNNAPNHGP